MGIKKVNKAPEKATELEVEHHGNVTVVKGELPEDFDPSDGESIRRVLLQAITQSAPPDMSPEEVEGLKQQLKEGKGTFVTGGGSSGIKLPRKDAINLNSPDGLEKVLERAHKGETQELLQAIKANGLQPATKLPVPHDPIKAKVVTAYNNLHEAVHKLCPLSASLIESMSLCCDSFGGNQGSEAMKAAYCEFEQEIEKVARIMSKFGETVCKLGITILTKGIPSEDLPIHIN